MTQISRISEKQNYPKLQIKNNNSRCHFKGRKKTEVSLKKMNKNNILLCKKKKSQLKNQITANKTALIISTNYFKWHFRFDINKTN